MDTLCRLMLSALPETIDPLRLAKTGKEFSGSFDLRQLRRVNALLEDGPAEQLRFRLEFSRDEENRLFCVTGELETILPLLCQRCLQPMQHRVSGIINMAIVSSEAEANSLPAQIEPYVDTGVPVKLRDFIEDELLLAMPLVSLHEQSLCSSSVKPAERGAGREQVAKVNPFAELKNLKLRN